MESREIVGWNKMGVLPGEYDTVREARESIQQWITEYKPDREGNKSMRV